MAVGCFHSQAVAEGLLRRAGSRQVWSGLLSGAEAQEAGCSGMTIDLFGKLHVLPNGTVMRFAAEEGFVGSGEGGSLGKGKRCQEPLSIPVALAYRQKPTAHPDYVNQVFIDTNSCIERKGWKQVQSQQEQELVRDAITSELAQTGQPAPRSDPKATDAVVRGVEERLARVPSSAR